MLIACQFDLYCVASVTRMPEPPQLTTTPGSGPSGQYGFLFMQAAVMARQAADQVVTSTHKELCLYLKAPLKQVDDIMAWWGMCLHCTFVLLSSITTDSCLSNTLLSTQPLLTLQKTILRFKGLLYPLNMRSLVVA